MRLSDLYPLSQLDGSPTPGFDRIRESIRRSAEDGSRYRISAAEDVPPDHGSIRATNEWELRGYVRPRHEEALGQVVSVINPVEQGRGLADTVRAAGRLVTGEGDADDVVAVGAALAMGRLVGDSAKGVKFSNPEVAARFNHVYTPKQQAAWAGKPARMSVQDRLREINRVESELMEPQLRRMAGSDYEYAKPVVRWDARQARLLDRARGALRKRELLERGFYDAKNVRWGKSLKPAAPEPPTAPDAVVPEVPVGKAGDFVGPRSREGAARVLTPKQAAERAAEVAADRAAKDWILEQHAAELGVPSIGSARVMAGWWKSLATKHPKTAAFIKWGIPGTAGGYAVVDAIGDAQVAAAKKSRADLVRASYSNQVDQARLRLARHEAASTNAASAAAFWQAPTEALVADLDSLMDDYKTIATFDPTNAPPADTVSRILYNYGHTPAPNRDRYTGKELPDYSEQFNRFMEAYRAKKEAVNAR